jgi:regulatory protein
VWHKKGVNGRKPRPPLRAESLNELALAYVGRFATTRAKLRSYLNRKLRERGWEGERAADVDGLVERLAGQGYVDDAAFALSKSQSLTARGYGERRVRQSLLVAGVAEEDGAAARAHAELEAVDSAIRFARRRRIGPFATSVVDLASREKAIAAMIRAGHGFALSRTIAGMAPGEAIDAENLAGL